MGDVAEAPERNRPVPLEHEEALERESAPALERVSLRQAIGDPGRYLRGPCIALAGRVVVLDHDLKRLDLAEDGAKLIVSVAGLEAESAAACGTLELGSSVAVAGRLKKRERRTFLEALRLEPQ
mmetsp:Transcript_20689/g.64614  ORF Transcript_20689/g.64614 Transcript_20689/m.64614 type:complete len:124 (+) Transcript_20689:62-433(+)